MAEAHVAVAEANRDYTQTMLAYTKIRAPFDGVVTHRNINTGDFLQPASTASKGRPIFVISQIDPVPFSSMSPARMHRGSRMATRSAFACKVPAERYSPAR